MNEQSNATAKLRLACETARRGEWLQAQKLCAALANEPMPTGAIARLDILICQYHLGSVQLIPERALPLLAHLPVGAQLACAGLSLLAARKSETLLSFKEVVLALADRVNEPLDLPTVPTFVMVGADPTACSVVESSDGALMSEVVQAFLDSDVLAPAEVARLHSLADRYRVRASIVAASDLVPSRPAPSAPRKPWWRLF